MDKQILEILLELQKGMKDVKTDIQEIKRVVNRIEASQTEDVVGMLKVNKKKQVSKLNS